MGVVKLEGNRRIFIGHLIKDAEYAKVGQNKDKDRTKIAIAYALGADHIINCTLWHGLAVRAAGLKKYDCIIVCGEVKENEYNGKKYYDLSVEDAIWTGGFMSKPEEVGKNDAADDNGFTDVDPKTIPF